MMWIQEWEPGRWGIWQEGEVYFCVQRNKGRGNGAYLAWRLTRCVVSFGGDQGFYPHWGNEIAGDWKSFVGRSRELNRLWQEIMENPVPFIMRQAL